MRAFNTDKLFKAADKEIDKKISKIQEQMIEGEYISSGKAIKEYFNEGVNAIDEETAKIMKIIEVTKPKVKELNYYEIIFHKFIKDEFNKLVKTAYGNQYWIEIAIEECVEEAQLQIDLLLIRIKAVIFHNKREITDEIKSSILKWVMAVSTVLVGVVVGYFLR